MDTAIINKKLVKSNTILKQMQKKAKKYYVDKLFAKNRKEPKAKLRKVVDLEAIPFVSLLEQNKEKDISSVATKEQLITACKNHHLTGRSGNGFPTADKLTKLHTTNGILLINGVECDPGLIHDAWLYRNQLDKVDFGAKLLMNAFHFKQMVLATKEPLQQKNYSFEQIKVKDRFPMGYEKALIKTVLGIELEKEDYPLEKEILVLNLQTVVALAELFLYENEPDNKYLTVADFSTGKAVAVKAPLGMDAKTVFQKAMPTANDSQLTLYIGSGALSCHALKENECITNQTNLVALGTIPAYEKTGSCAGCGGCNRVCPMGISVSKIVQYVDKNGKVNPKQCAPFHPDQCIGCGACTYLCSAGKDTRALVAWAKNC